MRKAFYTLILFTFCLCQSTPKEERLTIESITTSEDTSQDFTPWLNDDLEDFVKPAWGSNHNKYIDVTLKLESKSKINRISLYDYQGIFKDKPAKIYVSNENQKTLVGTFTGEQYKSFVDITLKSPLTGDAVIIEKFGNNIPQKVRVFGEPLSPSKKGSSSSTLTQKSTSPKNSVASSTSAKQSESEFMIGSAKVIHTTVSQKPDEPSSAIAPKKEGDRLHGKLRAADYQFRWMYATGPKPKDTEYPKLMDGVLNEKITLNWSVLMSKNYLYQTFPEEMDFTLESLRIYDGDGGFGKPIRISFIKRDPSKPGGIDWKKIPGPVFYGNNRLVWDNYEFTQPLKIYAIILEYEQMIPGEIEIYGSWKPYAPKPFKQKNISLASSLRVNAYIWNFQQPSGRPINETKMEVMKAFTGIRDYVDWIKIEKVKGEYTFSPVSEGSWSYDLVYERLKKEGIEVLACFKNNTPWSLEEFGYPDKNAEYTVAPWTRLSSPEKPKIATSEQNDAYQKELDLYEADISRIRENPKSYEYFCKAAFQFTARYGSNKQLNPDLVKVASNQTKRIGLDYIRAIECNNETDAWWHGRKRYMTPREYAYLLSAFYDGHMNTMGPGVGVKNADPHMLVVATGIASNSPAYFQGVIDTWREIRGYRKNKEGKLEVNMACDVWNFHAYANNGGGQYSNASWGLPPEKSSIPSRVHNFVQVISEVGNDLPVWITEVGYEVNNSSQQALATPTRTKLQTQGDWIIRTILSNIRNGVSETYFYQAYDETSYTINVWKKKPDNRTYVATGLIQELKNEDGSSNISRRPVADYMKQLHYFKDYTYQRTIAKDPLVDIYDLKGKKMYALVVPDMVGRTKSYTMDVGKAAKATIYHFQDHKEEFRKEVVSPKNGKLTLTVTESPLFVTLN